MARSVRDLLVRIRADGAELEKELNSAARNLDAVGRRAERIGRDLTLKFTAPLVLAGAAATKLAVDFDREMTKIVTLVGIAEDQVNEWRGALLELGPAVGKSPRELAEALFVVTSAGARGAEALQILERAAKASAAGLGETTAIARTVTAAMTAYKDAGLTAERATDILVATVRAGNLEAEALAGSLGRVLGTAAQVGVTFQQVGTFIATFTRLGVSAEEAVVALRGVLSTVQKPTAEAEKALAAMGLSLNDLRVSIVERGLAETLVNLVRRAAETGTEMAAIVPNVRALSGVLGTAGVQAEAFADIAEEVAGSMGILDDAFARVEQTPAHTFAQLRAAAEALAISIGDALAPTLNELLRSLLPLLRTLREVDPELVKNTARVLALAAALGPLILAFGAAARTAATLANTLLLARTAGIALGSALAPAGAVLAGLALLTHWLVRTQTEAVRAGFQLAQLRADIAALGTVERREMGISAALGLIDVERDLEAARKKLEELQAQARADIGLGRRAAASGGFAPGAGEAEAEVARLEARQAELRQTLDAVNDAERRAARSAAQLADDQARASEEARRMIEEFERLGQGAEETGTKLREPAKILEEMEQRIVLADRLGELSDGFDANQLSASAMESALQELLLQLDAQDERVRSLADRLNSLREATQGVASVQEELRARLELANALGEASAETYDATALRVAAYEAALSKLVEILGATHPAVREVAAALADERAEMEATAQAQRKLNSAVSLAASLIAQARTPAEDYQAAIEGLTLALDAGRIGQEEFNAAQAQAKINMEESEEAARRAGRTIEEEFADRVVMALGRVSSSWREMADDVIAQIARIAAEIAAAKFLEGLGGGQFKESNPGWARFLEGAGKAVLGAIAAGVVGAAFGGGRAHGGPVSAGRSYIVGERGPELFLPRTAGTIIPRARDRTSPAASPSEVAAEILSRVGPHPGPTDPHVAAHTEYYRRLFSEALADAEARGWRMGR